MRKFVPLALVQLVACAQTLTPAWIELGEGGRAIARVIVNSAADCPSLDVDGDKVAMSPRNPVPAGFRPACEAAIPSSAVRASLNSQVLPLPHADPVNIVVLGDTGCRIKGDQIQDCNTEWPFEQVADAAASVRPNLVIHVGDYLYREDECPADARKKCGGSPHGDNWETWQADFFRPAAKLLASAPWSFSRGNHEDCGRSWRGWFYYLDPRPWQPGPCDSMSPPYMVQLGAFQLIEFDSSAVRSAADPGQVKLFASELTALHAQNAWLVDHHPFWAFKPGKPGSPAIAETDVLQRAWEQSSPQGIGMVLSGHTHVFELLSYGKDRPLQIVAGDAGTSLDHGVRRRMNGFEIYGMMVEQSEDADEFGYTLLSKTKTGWDLSLRNLKTKEVLNCAIQGRTAKCK